MGQCFGAQPLGIRKLADVWNRQLRWARLRRASFTTYFAAEILTGAVFPVLAATLCATEYGLSAAGGAAALLGLVWYGAEALMAIASGWHVSLRAPLLWMLRDLMIPVLWAQAWLDSKFVWRGNQMHVAQLESIAP